MVQFGADGVAKLVGLVELGDESEDMELLIIG